MADDSHFAVPPRTASVPSDAKSRAAAFVETNVPPPTTATVANCVNGYSVSTRAPPCLVNVFAPVP